MVKIESAEEFDRIRAAHPICDALLSFLSIWSYGHSQYCLRSEDKCSCGFYDKMAHAMRRLEQS